MSTLLIKNAYIVTMDNHQWEIPEGGLFMRDGFIEQVGAAQRTASNPPMRCSTSKASWFCPASSTRTITFIKP
jgi:hypothetical protein